MLQTGLLLVLIGASLAAVIPDAPPYDEDATYMMETRAGLFEGDIQTGGFRNLIKWDNMKWTKNIIPYTIDRRISSNQKAAIHRAMAEIKSQTAVNGKTCIDFVPRSSQRNYVFINPGSGCWSWIGMKGGQQKLNLDRFCWDKGTIIHELLHAVGFSHEQARFDRDKYVDIFRENIQYGEAYNFNIRTDTRTFGTAYDYDSIMHYGPYEFSRNRKPTILPKDRSKSIGNRQVMSATDIRKIRMLYNCGGTDGGTVTTSKPITGGDDCSNRRGDTECDNWAANGKCTAPENEQWMKIHCTKACKRCPPASCQDTHDADKCSNWAATGECYKNPNWMHVNCSRSCNECGN